MKKNRSTKRALLMSVLAMVLCLSMLVGSTFAWFTDSVTSSGNIIKSGTLDVELLDASGASLEGKVIKWATADNRAQEAILWEPGCTYKTEPFTVKNAGNLALKYEIVINGIDGDAKLLEAVEWTVTVDGVATELAGLKGELLANTSTAAIVLSGHMKEEAGNEYQGLTAEGISVTVLATQLTAEKDSFDDQYDKNATLPEVTVVSTAAELQAALAAGGNVVLAGDITLDVADTAFTVAKGVSTKLDLNGHNITATGTSKENVQLFSVNGNLEIVGNGTISLKGNNFPWNTSYRYTAINIRETGVVTLGNGVKVVCEAGTEDGYGMSYAVDIYTTGTLNVNGASLHSNYIAVRCFYGDSIVNVNSGSITSSKNNYGIWLQSAPGAKITVADGINYTINPDNGIYSFN